MSTTVIQTYASWAKANDKKCRRFSHYEKSVAYYRITDRRSILHEAGFRMCAEPVFSASDLTPREAVKQTYDGTHAHLLYYSGSIDVSEITVWFKD